MTPWLGLLVVAAAVFAVLRRVDVRLALLVAALVLGALAGKPAGIVQKFFETFTSQQFLVPICSAMGFAYALRHTGCDRDLVRLLSAPLRRWRNLLIPGAVLVGFTVNIPIISQASTVVAVGAVLAPLLLAAGISPITTGAALLLGASIGGELFNPGAPEFRTIVAESAKVGITVTGVQCSHAAALPNLFGLAIATLVFWWQSLRFEARLKPTREAMEAAEDAAETDAEEATSPNLLRALVPLVPLALLFLTAPPLELLHVPHDWLVGGKEASAVLKDAAKRLADPTMTSAAPDPFDSRLIGAAMLIGVGIAALANRRTASGVVPAFFEGAGYALTNIVSIIVAATCFGEGVKLVGLSAAATQAIGLFPHALLPAAALLPLGFAFISGSGFASTQSLFGAFVGPTLAQGLPTEFVGAVVSLAGAAGRTMSPVAAVVLMCATMTGTPPGTLARRVAPPLLAGIAGVVLLAMVMAPSQRRAVPAPGTAAPAVSTPTPETAPSSTVPAR